MSPEFYDAFVAGWRILLLTLLPILGCVGAASLIITALQTATGTSESSLGVLARVLALLGAIYLFAPGASAAVMELLVKVLH